MHQKFIVLIFVVVFLTNLATADSPWRVTEMRARITFSGEATIQREGTNPKINWVEGRFYLAPLHLNVQSPKLVGYMPDEYRFEEDENGNRYVVFRWENPTVDSLPYAIVWEVVVNGFNYTINSLGDLGRYADNLKKYLEPDELTLWTGYMKSKADSIIQGSRSVVEAAKRLCNWVSSALSYDDAYWKITASAQEAFSQRKGTCDEYANLFIAMSRSVGIPTRYVEGLVYSGESWNYHAWAEVYASGAWIPVDPTYNEIGFLDSTHIALAKVVSDEDVYNRIKWAGIGVRASFGKDDKQIEMTTESGDILEINLSVPESIVGSEIFDVVAEITNTLNSYAVATCAINMPVEMILLDYKEKSVILEPRGKGRLSWRIASPGNLDRRWLHKMPVQIYCFPSGFVNKSVIIDPRYSKEIVRQVTISDLVILNGSTSMVRVRNDGTGEISKLNVELCLENNNYTCKTNVVRGLEPGGTAEVFFEIEVGDGDTVSVTVESDELGAVHSKTTVSGLEKATKKQEETKPPVVLKSMEARKEEWVIIVLVVIILAAIMSAVAASIIRRD